MCTTVGNRKKERIGVYIGRPSKWGNPFHIGKDGTREEVIQKFKAWVETSRHPNARFIRSNIRQLRGKHLLCWCSPLPCHGDLLALWADTAND